MQNTPKTFHLVGALGSQSRTSLARAPGAPQFSVCAAGVGAKAARPAPGRGAARPWASDWAPGPGLPGALQPKWGPAREREHQGGEGRLCSSRQGGAGFTHKGFVSAVVLDQPELQFEATR